MVIGRPLVARPKGPPKTKLVRIKVADAHRLEDIANSLGDIPIHQAFHQQFGRSVERKHLELCGRRAKAHT